MYADWLPFCSNILTRFFLYTGNAKVRFINTRLLLAAQEEQAGALSKHAAPIPKGQCSSTSSDVSSYDSRSFSDSGSEDKEEASLDNFHIVWRIFSVYSDFVRRKQF